MGVEGEAKKFVANDDNPDGIISDNNYYYYGPFQIE